MKQSLKHFRDKYQLNPKLKPSEIRRLCFTRLEDVFSLKDRALFDMWSQHKPKRFTLEKHYIKGKLDKAIEYLPKIQDVVLIDNVESYIREIENYKNGINRVRELETVVKDMFTLLSGTFEQVEEEKDIEPRRYEVFKRLGNNIEKLGLNSK